MVKVEIDVDQVITAAVSLEVEPGDKLLVMNGIVIGMVEGRHPRRPIQAVAPPAPVAPKRRDLERYVQRHDPKIQERIVAILRDKPMTAGKIAQRLRQQNGGQRLIIREVMVGLRQRGLIEAVSKDRFPQYRLTPAVVINGAGA